MTLTRKGWNSLKPITAPEQISTPIHWNPMSDDWKRWIDSHQVYNGESRFSKEMLDAMKALHDKILSFGGDEVCMTAYDEDAVKALSRGQFFYGSSYMRKGQPSQCHANSANLWDANRGHCFIATGCPSSTTGWCEWLGNNWNFMN